MTGVAVKYVSRVHVFVSHTTAPRAQRHYPCAVLYTAVQYFISLPNCSRDSAGPGSKARLRPLPLRALTPVALCFCLAPFATPRCTYCST